MNTHEFHVQQENERTTKRERRSQQAMQKEVLQDEQRKAERGRLQPGREVVHAEQGIDARGDPIRPRRFGVPRFIVERGRNPIPGFKHFTRGTGIAAFVAIGQSHVGQAEQEQQAPADEQKRQVEGVRGKRLRFDRGEISHGPRAFAADRSASNSAGRPACRFPVR